MNIRTSVTERNWLIVILAAVIALGILVGAIAAGRMRFLFPG
jgi:hypothetical protein